MTVKITLMQIGAAAFLIGSATLATAGETFRVGAIEIQTPWARASIGTLRPAAAYMIIRNSGSTDDRLKKIASPVAERAEIHTTIMTNGMMRMIPAENVDIAPGGVMKLVPGGRHIMLMKLQKPLVKGQETELTLTFERAGTVTVRVPIFGPGASGPKDKI